MTAKIRPCRKQVFVSDALGWRDCTYPAMKGKQACVWHWLAKQPADVQRKAAEQRRDHLYTVIRMRVPKEEWPPGERWCAGCQSFVPLFYCTGSRCKSCASSAAHGARVEKTYGITPERYDELLAQQGGRCAICRARPRTMRLAVDHNHKTGEPRGLLCKRCNHDLLGAGHDDPLMLWAALKYLLFPPASYPEPMSDLETWEALRARRYEQILRDTPRQVAPEDPPF